MSQPRYRRLLTDRTGIAFIEQHAHVKITHPRHTDHGSTGTIVRIDPNKRKVWVALKDGRTVQAGSRSVEVL
jgi:hypothetical protein